MSSPQSPRRDTTRTTGGRKRMTAAERKRLYRRRRIVFFSALAVVLALAVFTVYSLVRGAVSVHGMAGASAAPALSRAEVPAAPQKSKVETCMPGDVGVQLVPDATSVGVGGSLNFTERVAYVGKSPEGCRMNTAADSLVLTITSGSDVIWRSDVCEAAYRPRLFFADVTDEQKIAWNTNRTGASCMADDQLPKVDRGTYVAQLSLKDDPKVQSKPQTITVE